MIGVERKTFYLPVRTYIYIYFFSVYFLLFPYPKNFLFFGISLSNLEKIGIDEKVICYHNISNLLWEKDVLCAWKRKWISKTLQIRGLTASYLQTFFSIFFLTLEQFFLTVRLNNYGNKIPFFSKQANPTTKSSQGKLKIEWTKYVPYLK